MKKLLILGNGYHIGNNYKTSYKNFKSFLKDSKKYFKVIEQYGHIKSESRDSWHPAVCDMVNVNDIDEYFLDTASIAEANYSDILYVNKFKETKLYKILENDDLDLWSDVEEGIKTILDKICKFYKNEIVDDTMIIEFFKMNKEEELVNEIYENVLLFEKAFASYILIFNEPFDCGMYDKIGDKYLKKNINMNLRQYFSENFDVISFNYFKCTGDIDLSINREENSIDSYINIHNTIECNRNFDKQIIIGIQDGFFNDKLYVKFEKIQRMYELGIDIASKLLDNLKKYDEFIVYGHSLGLSDYYFFSRVIDLVIKYDKKLIIYYYSTESRKKFVTI